MLQLHCDGYVESRVLSNVSLGIVLALWHYNERLHALSGDSIVFYAFARVKTKWRGRPPSLKQMSRFWK